MPEAKARGYHGYAARAGTSSEACAPLQRRIPDIILPVRGPAITDPQASITRLIERLQTFLQSHFETDALRWYWGDENHRIRSRAVDARWTSYPWRSNRNFPLTLWRSATLA